MYFYSTASNNININNISDFILQKLKRQEEMTRKQKEIQKETEQKRKDAAERKFQERKAARQNGAPSDHVSSGGKAPGNDPLNSTGIFIPERDIERRMDSPPIPSMRGKQAGNGKPNSGNNWNEDSNQDDILTASDGGTGLTTSDDDQDTAQAKQHLNNMKKQLDRKEEELSSEGEHAVDTAKRRQSEVWEGLAEV